MSSCKCKAKRFSTFTILYILLLLGVTICFTFLECKKDMQPETFVTNTSASNSSLLSDAYSPRIIYGIDSTYGKEDTLYTRAEDEYSDVYWNTNDIETTVTKTVDPDKSLIFYGNTEKNVNCCKQWHATNIMDAEQKWKTDGCPCFSREQLTIIKQRGGNNITIPCQNDQKIF